MLAAWSGELFRCMKNAGVHHGARWQKCWSHPKQELSFSLCMFWCESSITWWLISPLHPQNWFFSKAPVNKPVCTVSQAMEQVAQGGCAISMLGCFQAQAGGSPEQIWPEADAAVSGRLDQRPPEILSSLIILWSQTTSFANKSSLLNHTSFCFWSVPLTVQKKNLSCSDNRASMSMTERNILYALTCDVWALGDTERELNEICSSPSGFITSSKCWPRISTRTKCKTYCSHWKC